MDLEGALKNLEDYLKIYHRGITIKDLVINWMIKNGKNLEEDYIMLQKG